MRRRRQVVKLREGRAPLRDVRRQAVEDGWHVIAMPYHCHPQQHLWITTSSLLP